MNNWRLTLLIVIFQVISVVPASAQGEYFACVSCHGEKGEGVAAKNAPALAGLTGEYVRRQMQAFREGKRGAAPSDRFGVEMALIASAYDEGSVGRLAAIVESFPQSPRSLEASIVGDKRRGQTLYALCNACHGDEGEGSAVAPMLAGQNPEYLVRQLANFRDGLRGAHADDNEGASMGRIVRAGLTGPNDFEALAAYVGSLPH